MMFVGAENLSHGAPSGIRAGVMQLMFNPARPYLLYASFRRHEAIYAWDLRGDVSKPVHVYTRQTVEASTSMAAATNSAPTNQKLKFDLDITGKVLGVGDQLGNITLFDTTSDESAAASNSVESEARVERPIPILRYAAHDDVIGSVSFHPLRPVLLSVSGSRHFDGNPAATHTSLSSSSDSESDDQDYRTTEGCNTINQKTRVVRIRRKGPQPTAHDSSAKLWNFDSRVDMNRSTINPAS